MGKPYVFLDLRSDKTSELGKPRMAHPFGYTNDVAEWHNIMDAFFFIDVMEPDVNRPPRVN
jgi:hypothetical protein